MTEINRHHRVTPIDESDFEFYFNENKVTNDFLADYPFLLSLEQIKKEFKVKNFDHSLENENIICIRSPIKMSRYSTLPSLFVRKTDKKLLNDMLTTYSKDNFFTFVPVAEKRKIEETFLLMKKEKISVAKYRTIIIDYYTLKQKYHTDIELIFSILKSYSNKSISSNPIKAYDIFIDKYNTEFPIKNKEYLDNLAKAEIEKQERARINLLKKIEKEKKEEQQRLELLEKQRAEDKIKLDKRNSAIHYSIQHMKDYYSKYIYLFSENNIIKLTSQSIDNILNQIYEFDINSEERNQFIIEFLKKENSSFEIVNSLNSFLYKISYKDITNLKKLNNLVYKLERRYIKDDLYLYPTINIKVKTNTNKSKSKKKQRLLVNLRLNQNKEQSIINSEDFYNIRNKIEPQFIYILEDFFDSLKEDLIKIIESNLFINLSDKMEIFEETFKRVKQIIAPKIVEICKDKHITINYTLREDFSLYKLHEEISFIKKEVLKIFKTQLPTLFNLFQDKIIFEFRKELVAQNVFFSDYKDIFHNARKIDREIVYFSGTTNSGKTYAAFEELKNAESGIYLAPLRLLAIEGQEEIEKRGIECSMLTGEERDVKNSSFLSCTIEMADYNTYYDVAIIDEVQMLVDEQRGAAWLQAIVGIRAKKIILVGSPDISRQVEFLAKYLNEPIKTVSFERKNPLSISEKIDIDQKLPQGTAVIAFSRNKVYALKEHFSRLGNSVSIIYGALPPNIKRENAELFKNGESEVLISTDAIAMGLNLPIQTIVFYETEKYDGKSVINLPIALVKQISGRAGRYGIYEEGHITAFYKHDYQYIKRNLHEDSTCHQRTFRCNITTEIFSKIKEIAKTNNVSDIIDIFDKNIKFSFIHTYVTEEQKLISKFLNDYTDYFHDHEIVKIIRSPFFDNNLSINLVKFFVESIVKARKEKDIIYTSNFLNKFDYLIGKKTHEEIQYKSYDLLSNFIFSFKEFDDLEEYVLKTKEKLNEKIRQYAVERELKKLKKKQK